MPYTSSLNIEKIATGTGTGTWGNSTNVNWDRIDAFSGGYISISLTSITAYVLDTFEGAVPDAAGTAGDGGGTGWNKNVVFTGSPGGAVTVTIKPVTSKKWYFVRNDTDEIITFQQTPGTTVSLAVGYSTIIYCTGANVVRAIDDLEIDSLKVNTLIPIGATGSTTNVVIGTDAGAVATGAADSVLIGKEAGKTITTGDKNVVMGALAAKSAGVDIEENVIIGYNAGLGHDDSGSVVIGFNACSTGASGAGLNTAVGGEAGRYMTTGFWNTFVGYGCGKSDNTNKLTANSCVAVGADALNAITSGFGNTVVGANSLSSCTDGATNSVLGGGSAQNLESGDGNVVLGSLAGVGLVAEDRNILIGYTAGFAATGGGDDILVIDTASFGANQSASYFIYGDMGNDLLNFNSASSSGSHVKIQNTNAAGSGYNFLECVADSDGSPATKFQVRGDGQVQVNGVEVHAADYADMFEWSDGNPEAEDRIGLSVVLDDGGVLPATVRDDPDDIVGVVSGTACMIGNSAWGAWEKKFLKDDFGRVVMETVDDAATPILNPEYDEAREYHARMARSEWAVIGLTGRIHLRKGSPTHPSWKKIRDVSAVSEEWLVR